MRFDSFCKTGSYHLSRGAACQDAVRYGVYEDFAVAAAADGASACEHAGEGAEIACRAFVDLAAREQARLFGFSDRKLAYLLTEHILYFLEAETGKRGGALQDYASTITGAVMERKTGNAILVNLGDGAVYQAGAAFVTQLLPPVRFGGRPCLTTTKGAHQAMAVRRTGVLLGEGLFLCTDGLLEALRGERSRAARLLAAMESLRTETLRSILDAADTVDDCAWAAIIRDRKQERSADDGA